VRVTPGKKDVHVPWLDLGREQNLYLDADTLPDKFQVIDPSKMVKAEIGRLWEHWSDRARANLPILVFTSAREQDTGLSGPAEFARRNPAWRGMKWRKRLPSDSESDDQTDADKDKGVSGPPVRPPSPKRRRLSKKTAAILWPGGEDVDSEPETPLPNHPLLSKVSKQTVVADEQSPAANNSSRMEFLRKLSGDASYVTLLDGALALPAVVSPFFCISNNLSDSSLCAL
jgi:hypothetical protein